VKEISVLRDKANITVDMQENKVSHATEEITQSREKEDQYYGPGKERQKKKKSNPPCEREKRLVLCKKEETGR
jgi:hypothetical protein